MSTTKKDPILIPLGSSNSQSNTPRSSARAVEAELFKRLAQVKQYPIVPDLEDEPNIAHKSAQANLSNSQLNTPEQERQAKVTELFKNLAKVKQYPIAPDMED